MRKRTPEYPSTFLKNVARAADKAMEEVLEEDRLLRDLGIEPESGRSR